MHPGRRRATAIICRGAGRWTAVASRSVPVTASVFFLAIRAAGGGRGRAVWRAVQNQARRRELAFEFEFLRAPLTGLGLVRQALRAGARTIVAVGGDGTVHEAVNGFFLGGELIRED